MVLDAPAASKWNIAPAPLLAVGTLDGNQGSLKNQTFTLVGYGVDIGVKKSTIVVPERRFTTLFLKNVQDELSPSRSTTGTRRPAVAPVSATPAGPRSSARTWWVTLPS